ncbi:MAG: tetratricopeptide repeat protein [Pyrinomonadaceae bacterium]|nr:tetratricopeptide repeat protein [Pyrinomonadaceae bacterium]
MKKLLFPILTICLLAIAVTAQKLPKPTQLPSTLSAEENKTLNAGIVHHDAKRYDEAIAQYDKILAGNADATIAIYEKALSLYAKGDRDKAMETAYLGAKYKSDELAMFYSIMANCLDDVGKGDDALKIYREAESILKSDVGMARHLSSVYYNIGVTYVRQKKYVEARAELKKAVETNFAYASPHYLLSVVYQGTKYRIPAFAAAARFLTLEYNSKRSATAANIITEVLKPAEKDPKTGSINIFMDMNAPKDEGDFGMYDLMLGTLTTVKSDKDKNKSENEVFVEALGTVIGLLAEDKKLGSSFVGKNYIPFLVELKKKGHLEPFGYMVLYISGKKDAMTWLEANNEKFGSFLAWSKAFQAAK